jgi:hypothetical protein
MVVGKSGTERERERDRDTDREKEKEKERVREILRKVIDPTSIFQ